MLLSDHFKDWKKIWWMILPLNGQVKLTSSESWALLKINFGSALYQTKRSQRKCKFGDWVFLALAMRLTHSITAVQLCHTARVGLIPLQLSESCHFCCCATLITCTQPLGLSWDAGAIAVHWRGRGFEQDLDWEETEHGKIGLNNTTRAWWEINLLGNYPALVLLFPPELEKSIKIHKKLC